MCVDRRVEDRRPMEGELTAGHKQRIGRCSLQKTDSEMAFSLVLPFVLRLVCFLRRLSRDCKHI